MVAIEKEQGSRATGSKRLSSRRKTITKRSAQKKEEVYCLCKGKDDGRPMIRCENCNDWYVVTLGESLRKADSGKVSF